MNKTREYFIGDILKKTNDPFDHARAIMLLRFSIVFLFVFLLPLISDIILGYEKATIIHSIILVILFFNPFIIRKQKNIDKSINLFFSIVLITSFLVNMMLNPMMIDPIACCWTMFFLVLSALLQQGLSRIIFCCFLLWIPVIYVLLNIQLKGALTINWLVQKGAENPPIFLMFIPIILCIYAIWSHTSTITVAKATINEQKAIINEKNNDIIASLHYAKRIQDALMPSEKQIEKILKNKKG